MNFFVLIVFLLFKLGHKAEFTTSAAFSKIQHYILLERLRNRESETHCQGINYTWGLGVGRDTLLIKCFILLSVLTHLCGCPGKWHYISSEPPE